MKVINIKNPSETKHSKTCIAMEVIFHNMNESTYIDKPSKARDIDSEPFSESLNNLKNNDYT